MIFYSNAYLVMEQNLKKKRTVSKLRYEMTGTDVLEFAHLQNADGI